MYVCTFQYSGLRNTSYNSLLVLYRQLSQISYAYSVYLLLYSFRGLRGNFGIYYWLNNNIQWLNNYIQWLNNYIIQMNYVTTLQTYIQTQNKNTQKSRTN